MEYMTPLRPPIAIENVSSVHYSSTSIHELVTATSSPGSRVATPHDPRSRPHLSIPKHNFELLASRTVSQAISEEAYASKPPASPLDAVNPSINTRFPRFSITTESSHPDLSSDDVISTRISLDEEGIVATPKSSHASNMRSGKRQKLQIALHRAISTPSLGFRRVGYRIKRAPSFLLSRRTSKPSTQHMFESQADDIADKANASDAARHLPSSLEIQRVIQSIDIDSSSTYAVPATADHRPAFALPDLPEDPPSEGEATVFRGQLRTPDPFGASSTSSQFPGMNTPRFALCPSSMAVDTCQTSQEQIPRKSPVFLGRMSSWSNVPNAGLPRSISLGSIDELRCNAFVSNQRRIFTMPTVPSRHSSLVGTTCSTPRRSCRTLSVCDVGALTNPCQLRGDPMFVDIQEGQQVNFVFPPSSDERTPSPSPGRTSLGLKAHSYQSLRKKQSSPVLMCSSRFKSRFDETHGKEKIPLFVPSRIVKPAAGRLAIPERQSSRLSPDAALRSRDAGQDEQFSRQENHSGEAPSEASDWSTTVQFGAPKQDVLHPCSEASAAPNDSSIINQEYPVKGGKPWKSQGDAPGEFALSGSSEVKRPVEKLTGGRHRSYRGLLQNCWTYLHRVKQHLWRDSDVRVNKVLGEKW